MDGTPALRKYWQFALRGGAFFLGLPGARPLVQWYAGNLQPFRMMCRGFDSRRVREHVAKLV